MENEVKKLFKTVMEFSLYAEPSEQFLLSAFELQLGSYLIDDLDNDKEIILEKEFDEEVIEMALHSIFYDFLHKAITLNETNMMLQNILKSSGNEILLIPLSDDSIFDEANTSFIYNIMKRSLITDIMKILLHVINDDEWVIHFFTNYIHEILKISKMLEVEPDLEFVDWEAYLVSYLMDEVTGKNNVL